MDVATVCMGRIKNGRIAKALREAAKEPELEARVAIFAVHVGMFVSLSLNFPFLSYL